MYIAHVKNLLTGTCNGCLPLPFELFKLALPASPQEGGRAIEHDCDLTVCVCTGDDAGPRAASARRILVFPLVSTMTAYNDLKPLIGALQVSADAHPSDGDPLLRPFDLANGRYGKFPF